MNLSTDPDSFFDKIRKQHILVIGDLMLDKYIWGKVDRISPEAPVPVIEVDREETRLGGAANVALNLKALGSRVSVCGVVGPDPDGGMLKFLLQDNHFDVQFVLEDDSRRTTTKTRIIASGQHVARLDRENRVPVPKDLESSLLESLLPKIEHFDAIIFEDYNKGLLNPEFISSVIQEAFSRNVPVIVDPKFSNFLDFKGCTLFKPNLRELNQALGLMINGKNESEIFAALKLLREKMPHQLSLVTLGELGILGYSEKEKFVIPAHLRKIRDVSGAGDTVVAVAAVCLAAELSLKETAAIANLAGGLVCEEVGVVPIQKERLFAEIKEKL